MSDQNADAPGLGERRARWGFGYQDKVATERILDALKSDSVSHNDDFEGVRLADLEAGQVDDFVLVWRHRVEGYSIKWSGDGSPLNWGDLIGVDGLLRGLSDGQRRLTAGWPNRDVTVHLQSHRPASDTEHPAQLIRTPSVSAFLRDHWNSGPLNSADGAAVTAWRTVASRLGMTTAALADFVASCRLVLNHQQPPARGNGSIDDLRHLQQFQALHQAIATWLTDNPTSEFVPRDALESAIDYRSQRSRLSQRFQRTEIPYEENRIAAQRLDDLVQRTRGGYLGVVGEAGIGKSTLVDGVLRAVPSADFVPYFAFLPNVAGNKDRGEALTFFQDVVERLDRLLSGRRSLGISDLTQGRDALRHHIAAAHDRYRASGRRIVLLIDGLDHVAREVGLQFSVLHELPPPQEVLDGFLIILSAQPQGLGPTAIHPLVAAVVAKQDRRLEVRGLSRPEVSAIVGRISKTTTGEERIRLADECRGNPLILTYLLKEFQRSPETSVEDAVTKVGHYDGPIDDYYRRALTAPLDSAESRHVLALLCRAAPWIPTSWIRTWPERHRVLDACNGFLAPFIRNDDGQINFIHDSLISFLKVSTRSALADESEERELHGALADRCVATRCEDQIGRARVFHLLKANRPLEVLQVLSSAWLRAGVAAFLPFAAIDSLLSAGFQAAWATPDVGEVLRLVLLYHELAGRASREEAGVLASTLLALDKPDLALAHVRTNGRMLVKEHAALKFSLELARYGRANSLRNIEAQAESLFRQAEPVQLLHGYEALDIERDRDSLDAVRAWASTSPLFDTPEAIATRIATLGLVVPKYARSDESGVRGSLLYGALLTALETVPSTAAVQPLLSGLARCSNAWRLAGLLECARRFPTEVSSSDLHDAYREGGPNGDLQLIYADILQRRGLVAEARSVVGGLEHERFDAVSDHHSFGLTNVRFAVELRRLQSLLELPEGTLPSAVTYRDTASAHVAATARRIGVLFAEASAGRFPDMRATFRSLLLFHNDSPEGDYHDKYVVRVSRNEIEGEIVAVAEAMGRRGLEALRDVYLELVEGPASNQFSSLSRRLFAVTFVDHGVISDADGIRLGMSSLAGIGDSDPAERREVCLDAAVFLHRFARDADVHEWLHRASDVSAGAGSHKDYHMADLATWLQPSLQGSGREEGLALLRQFAAAVEVAGGAGQSRAAASLLRVMLRDAPLRASVMAAELVNRDVLSVSEMLNAAVAGAAEAGASPQLLQHVYTELCALIDTSRTPATAGLVLQRFAPSERAAAAASIMAAARTNALSEDRRFIARSLKGALPTIDATDPAWATSLPSSRDESSWESSLYKMPDGSTRTIEQVAAWLGDPSLEPWNPNPGDNTHFDWWNAIRVATIRDRAHMEAIERAFPAPAYRRAETFAWHSRCLAAFGQRGLALEACERALVAAKEGTWHRWLDGAPKITALRALKQFGTAEAIQRGRALFGNDLAAGRINVTYVLSEIDVILDLLDLEWPGRAVRVALDDYLSQVLYASRPTEPYNSIRDDPTLDEAVSANRAVCRILVGLLAFPVADIGGGARRALARYLAGGGSFTDITDLLARCDSVQLEHMLIAIHCAAVQGALRLPSCPPLQELNGHRSLAVRTVARRICEHQGWPWKTITEERAPTIVLVGEPAPDDPADLRSSLDPSVGQAYLLHRQLFRPLQRAGLDDQHLWSEFFRKFEEIGRTYSWKDEVLLELWVRKSNARTFLRPAGILGREAAMRVLGEQALAGVGASNAEVVYDLLRPLYDVALELWNPMERPSQLSCLDWSSGSTDGEDWRAGNRMNTWGHYPDAIGNFRILGEVTTLTRAEWTYATEIRWRGVLSGSSASDADHSAIESPRELTHSEYLRGLGERGDQLCFYNSSQQLEGPMYSWIAFSANWARRLGWHPTPGAPLAWCSATGQPRVQPIYWRDGWTRFSAPHFEAAGEGWLLVASNDALNEIRAAIPNAQEHLWVRRSAVGSNQFETRAHLSRAV
jgi:hypothetical protein